MTEDQLLGLVRYAELEIFSPLEQAALALTDEMCATPALVAESTFAAVRALLTPAQVVELTAMIAWENYRSRFNRALAIGSDGFSEGAVCVMPVQ